MLSGLVALTACKRAAEEATQVSIQIPSAHQLSQKYGAQSVVDFNLLCFAVDIQGSSIPIKPADTCQPAKGEILGSVPPGGTIQGDVTEGTYTFKIYGFKRNSATEICPNPMTTDNFSGWPLKRIYFLGEAPDQAIAGATKEVPLTVTLPDDSNNLFVQNSLPAACAPTAAPPSKIGRVLSGASRLQGTTYRAYSRVNYIPVSKDLSGTNYKIKNWKAGAL